MPRCKCTNLNGERCGNMTKKGQFCARHKGKKCKLPYNANMPSSIQAQVIKAIAAQQQQPQVIYVERKAPAVTRPRIVYIDSKSNIPDAAPLLPKVTCACRTKDGYRCQRRPNKGSPYCSTHIYKCLGDYGSSAGLLMPPLERPMLMPPLQVQAAL